MIDVFFPKIQTLYERDKDTFKVNVGEFRVPEFGMFKNEELVYQEKIDGMNMRVWYDGIENAVEFGGRSNNAQIPGRLKEHMSETFTPEVLSGVFDPGCQVVMFGEGYGSGIQKGGGYQEEQKFILFDIKVNDWWLKDEDVEDVAFKLGIPTVPRYFFGDLEECVDVVEEGLLSLCAEDIDKEAEGVIIRPRIPLSRRDGSRLIAKLKTRDFKGGKM